MVAARGTRLSWAGARRAALRGLRWLGGGLGVLILLAVLSIFLPATRNLWLGVGIDRASRSLPGELDGRWSWPELNRLEGRSVVWTAPHPDAGRDTLAVLELLRVEFDLRALRAHDLRLLRVQVRSSLIDVPAITALLQTPLVTTTRNDSTAGVPWLREGSLPGAPSVSLAALDAQLADLILPDGRRCRNLSVRGSATILSGDPPHLVLESLNGQASCSTRPRWTAELASLSLAGAYDPADGTTRLDTLSAFMPRLEVEADTLKINAGPLDLQASGFWRGGRGELAGNLDFAAAVPAPLQAPLPGVEFREFSGRLGLKVSGDAQTIGVTAALELDPTEDVQQGRLDGSVRVGLEPAPRLLEARVDGLSLSWRGTELSARGAWDGSTVDGWAKVDLPDLQLPRLLAPGPLRGVTGKIRLETRFSGPQADPKIEAEVSASGRIVSIWDLPGMGAAAGRLPPDFPRGEFRQVNLDLHGVLSGSLEGLSVNMRADLGRSPWLDRGLLVGRTRLDLRARTMGALQLDTLSVALRQAEIFAAGSLDTAAADLAITVGLEGPQVLQLVAPEAVAGTDLSLTARGRITGQWRDLHIAADAGGRILHPEFAAPEWDLRVQGSADSLRVRLRATGGVRLGTVSADSLDADWTGSLDPVGHAPAGAFRLGIWAPRARAWAAGSAAGDSVRTVILDSVGFSAAGQRMESTEPVRIQVGPGPRDLAVSSLRLRGDLGSLSLAGQTRDGDWTLAADTDLFLTQEWLDTLFPAPFWSAGGGVDLSLEGHLELAAARGSSPDFAGRAGLALIPRSGEPPARLETGFRTAGGDTTGLRADLALSVGDTPLVQGTAALPGTIDPSTGVWRPAEGASGQLTIREQELPLAFINRFLPEEVSLEGKLTIGAGLEIAQAENAAADLGQSPVSGRLRAQGLRVNLPNRSRADLDGEVELAGSLIDPRLEGTVTVTSGLLRLPEVQRALLPVAGTSVLWETAGADSSALVEAWGADREPGPEPPLYLPDLALQVTIPGNFRIVGYGFDSELAGEFKVTRGWTENGWPVPVMRGRIRVVEGMLRALNRVFDVERGEFDLEGRIPADPALNLVLVTDIDGTVIRIRVTGTSLQPKIVLESEPEMVQADIMAFILFGRPVNDLDTDQRGSLRQEQTPVQQLRQNLQGLALVFGAAGLQNRVSGRIGVDQVQIGSDTAGGSTLMLGKFLNPRLLLKYHQSLERSGTYFMTLEYTLNRIFKLISTYGQGEEASGLELRWQRRY